MEIASMFTHRALGWLPPVVSIAASTTIPSAGIHLHLVFFFLIFKIIFNVGKNLNIWHQYFAVVGRRFKHSSYK